ncbi:hypothetical protein ACFLRI_00765 [Bacteroidota bacterium]
MRNLFVIMIVSLALFSCGNKQNGEVNDLDINTFGDEAANYVDQEISISGTVVHICKHGGKKMHLIGDNDEKKIVVFAGDDITEFPIELEGLMVKVTGVVKEEIITEETILEWEAEDAKMREEAAALEAEELAAEEATEESADIEVSGEVAGKDVELQVEDVKALEDGEVAGNAEVTVSGEATEEAAVEIEPSDDKHSCAEEATADPYEEIKKKIAESPDGKYRRYWLEVSKFEEVKESAE